MPKSFLRADLEVRPVDVNDEDAVQLLGGEVPLNESGSGLAVPANTVLSAPSCRFAMGLSHSRIMTSMF